MSSAAPSAQSDGACLPGSVSGAFNYLKNSETEIDFEGLGDQPDLVNITSWFNFQPDLEPLYNPTMRTTRTPPIPVPNNCQQFNTYKFRWEPGSVTFWANDNYKTQWGTTVPWKPAPILLNHWGTVDRGWGGNPNDDVTGAALKKPRYMYIDWVKYTPLRRSQ